MGDETRQNEELVEVFVSSLTLRRKPIPSPPGRSPRLRVCFLSPRSSTTPPWALPCRHKAALASVPQCLGGERTENARGLGPGFGAGGAGSDLLLPGTPVPTRKKWMELPSPNHFLCKGFQASHMEQPFVSGCLGCDSSRHRCSWYVSIWLLSAHRQDSFAFRGKDIFVL